MEYVLHLPASYDASSTFVLLIVHNLCFVIDIYLLSNDFFS